ncbi:MAG TPA: hypothetical protein VIK27_00205, partial [Candidatus Aquilonibacter sp.]
IRRAPDDRAKPAFRRFNDLNPTVLAPPIQDVAFCGDGKTPKVGDIRVFDLQRKNLAELPIDVAKRRTI